MAHRLRSDVALNKLISEAANEFVDTTERKCSRYTNFTEAM